MTTTRIDAELRRKIMETLDLKKSRFYDLIREVAAAYNIPRNHAAVKLAADSGISFEKYADEEYFKVMQNINNTGQIIITPPSLPIRASLPTPTITIQRPPIDLGISKLPNNDLRKILIRDVAELNCAIETGVKKTAKTCIVLSGSIAEALLLERLTRNPKIHGEAKRAASNLPKKEKPKRPNAIESWSLAQLVNISAYLNPPLLPSDSLSQIGQLRKWRNLIHPGRELKVSLNGRIKPTKTRANNSIAFLELIASELN